MQTPETYKTLTEMEIYLNKRRKVYLGTVDSKKAASNCHAITPRVATFNRNLEGIGFTMSHELLQTFSKFSDGQIDGYYAQIVPILRKMTGAHRLFKPMYPNFPKQVMEAAEFELYMNAITHYWVAFVGDVLNVPYRWLPSYKKDPRVPLPKDEVSLKVIDLGSHEDFESIFTMLVGSNSSISESDKDIVKWFIHRRAGAEKLLPSVIPQKENLALVAANLIMTNRGEYLTSQLKTATDILRVAVVMSDGDVSLAEPTKFRRFKRSERRQLLALMENAPSLTEDMLRRPEIWKRLGMELRPGDYQEKYPKTFNSFKIIRNDLPYETFNGKVEAGLLKGNILGVAELLSARPGDFTRRLDHLLRSANGDSQKVLHAFYKVAEGASTPVLLQAYAHFKNRDSGACRTFFPKGSVAKLQVIEEPLPPLPEPSTGKLPVANRVVDAIYRVLVKRFATLPSLGKVYLDDGLKSQFVPFAMRSASKTLRTIARGSRIALPDNKILRFFLWWKEPKDIRTDIDLSMVLLRDGFEYMTDCSYYNLRSLGCTHSGDITSAPNGACEFIDCDIDTLLQRGARYAVMCVFSFTQQPYKDLPECFAGWMGRSAAQAGQIFDARTVQDKIDLTAESCVAVPIAFDLKERKAIWVDLAMKNRNWINCGRTHENSLSKMVKAMATLSKPTLYDLFEMHAEARGTLVKDKAKADTVFSLYEGVTPFDTDKILSEYLQNAK